MKDGFYKLPNGSNGWFSGGAEPPNGSVYLGTEPPLPSIEQWRNNCTVSAADLRLALIDMQLLTTVQNAVKTASDAMQVKWEYETSLKRNDNDLVSFAKTQLSMADSEIDEVFKLAETK